MSLSGAATGADADAASTAAVFTPLQAIGVLMGLGEEEEEDDDDEDEDEEVDRMVHLRIIYCLIYVLPLYLSAATRPSPTRSRDAPEAIRARIRAVSSSTIVCSIATWYLLSFYDALIAHQPPLHQMGYWPVGVVESLRSLVLTALLFAGPLYESLIVHGAWKQWTSLEPLRILWSDWPTWRNLVAGPVTEECLFRAAGVPLLLRAHTSLTGTVFLSPLIFGLAHLHHFYEFRITNPRTPLLVAVARSVFQLSYTTLFGAYATFLFMRTGSLLAVTMVHAFCNCMGLPRFWGQVEPHWMSDEELEQVGTPKKWTVVYYLFLVGGLVTWWWNLYALTETSMALATF